MDELEDEMRNDSFWVVSSAPVLTGANHKATRHPFRMQSRAYQPCCSRSFLEVMMELFAWITCGSLSTGGRFFGSCR